MKTPEPLYPCADGGCWLDRVCAPEALFWSSNHQKYFCGYCWYKEEGAKEPRGISLAEHLKQTQAVMPRELTAENGAKVALIGEFREEINSHCLDCGGGGCEICGDNGFISLSVPVTWTTTKAIYRKAVETFEIKEKR